jgi:CheY-like chemotaxis protein
MPLDSTAAPILVVEDNEVNAVIIRAMLRRGGYASLVACNGREGVELNRLHRPALILMDLQMPVLDGFATASAIRQDPEATAPPIVAVTANAEDDVRRACHESGFAGVLAKPILLEELIETVRRHLNDAR